MISRRLSAHRKVHNKRFNALRTVCVSLEVILALGAVWLAFRFAGSLSASRASGHGRFCVDMLRHRVEPITPALAKESEGHEPWATGWLDVNVGQNELSWRIMDSLNTVPHQLSIRGPVDGIRGTAPVFVQLGTSRDASGRRLAGQLEVERAKLLEMHAHPEKFYISVSEWRANGDTRELARCRLDALPRTC